MGKESLEVLYRDEDLIAINKPSGIPMHKGWANTTETIASMVRAMIGKEKKVHLLHRLDSATSGVVLIATNRELARTLNREFAERRVQKRYLALTRGEAPEEGWIDHPVPKEPKGARVEAQTFFRRLAIGEATPRHVSLLVALPRTGRLHQIRRHLKHINHPLIGDSRYGKGPLNRAFKENYGLGRLGLHAHSIGFHHLGRWMTVEAAMPEDFAAPLALMGIEAERWGGLPALDPSQA